MRYLFLPIGLLITLSAYPANAIGFGNVPAWVPAWNSSADTQISYYNFCTGWAWAWSGWESGYRAGVTFESGCEAGESTELVDSRVFCWTGAAPGYGMTGTISVHNVDADLCPVDPPLVSQPWLPLEGNNVFEWNTLVGERFAVVVTFADDPGWPVNPTSLVTDHPDDTGSTPQACGLCYPKG